MPDEEPLTEPESLLWDYIKGYDFEGHPWSTPNASAKIGLSETVVYTCLSELCRKLKGKMYVYYRDGAIRIATE